MRPWSDLKRKVGYCNYCLRRRHRFCDCHEAGEAWFLALVALHEGNVPHAIRLLRCLFPSDRVGMIRKIELTSSRMLKELSP